MPGTTLLYSQPTPQPCFLYNIAAKQGLVTNDIHAAAYLLLPFAYETLVYNQPSTKHEDKAVKEAYEQMQQLAAQYEQLSITHQKKLIVFFYNDSEEELPFSNAIIFRTSWRRSKQRPNVFGMPAFVDSLPQNPQPTILPYQQQPTVSFRGQSAPLTVPITMRLKFAINRLLRKAGINRHQLKLWYLPNYLYRRAAIQSLLQLDNAIQFDVAITQHHGAYAHPLKNDYLQAMAQHAYILCVGGFGNYSYRFYEAIREARIPLFVDSDCLLPCTDVINWREHLVWIDTAQIPQTGAILLQFHRQCSPAQFETRQQQLRQLYNQYLTPEAFAQYVLGMLQNNMTNK